MNFYKQSIILFGVVIPALIAAVVVAGGYFVKKKMTESYEVKKRESQKYDRARSEVASLEQTVSKLRPHLERWEKEMSKEIASEMGTTLREITSKLPDKEIQQTAFNPSSNSGGLAQSLPSSQISLGFRGTFRTLQKTFLELETRMPQLQVEQLSLSPVTSSGYLLNMQVNYTAWE